MANFTKEAIRNTFVRLLDEKPLTKITVKEIVTECGINRNSFYYHYHDIPELVEELVKEEADRIIAAHPEIDSIEDCLTVAIEFADANRRALLHIYRSVNRDVFEQYLWKVCDYAVTTYGEASFAGTKINESDKAIIQQYYSSLSFGMVASWMESGMQDDVLPRIRRLCELKKGMAAEMIRRSEEHPFQ